MKKFSEIGSTFENKKYQEKSKNVVYSMIKENMIMDIKPLNESKPANLDNIKINLNGTNELVNSINKYVKDEILKERIKVLRSIKTAIATGTLNLQMINEEIENCECSETCPDIKGGDNNEPSIKVKKMNLNDKDIDLDDYDDDLDIVEPDTEYVTTDIK